jgi:hypothetical protein
VRLAHLLVGEDRVSTAWSCSSMKKHASRSTSEKRTRKGPAFGGGSKQMALLVARTAFVDVGMMTAQAKRV